MVCEGYRFDCFEVSVQQKLLRQGKERVKIQELPFRMLLALLERPGEIVSKKELGQRLWGEGRFAQADNGLYVVTAKLREVLGDNATQPRFIETISGRGYTFIGEVTPLLAAAVAEQQYPASLPMQAEQLEEAIILIETTESVGASAPIGRAGRWHRGPGRFVVWSSVAALLLTGLGWSIYSYFFRALVGRDDTIVFGGFSVGTGSHDLDLALASGVQVKLQESPYLSLISNQQFRASLKRADGASLQEELSGCAALHANVLVKGTASSAGRAFPIKLMAWRCSTGRLLTTQRVEASSESGILPAVDLVTERMRRRLGEPESSLRRFDVPLAQATTASLLALQAFTQGEQQSAQGDMNGAIINLKLAVDLDPQFALAYARLGTLYRNTGQQPADRQAFEKAFDLRARATDREKLYIVTHYYDYARGETVRAIAGYELWLTLYPRDSGPFNNLALEYLMMGSPRRALELSRRAVQLDPTNPILYLVLGDAYLKLGDYSNVRLICNDPVHVRKDSMSLHRLCFRAAFASDDARVMQQMISWTRGKPEEASALDDAAWAAMAQGKLSESKRLFADAKRIALQNNLLESASDVQLDQANLEADIGLPDAARKDALEALDVPRPSAFELAWSARALARVGEAARAQDLAKRASLMAPSDTILHAALLASARAATSLERHDGKGAVAALEEARPYDLCTHMEMSPGYYRGLAYLENSQPEKAVVEFKNVIDSAPIADFPVYVTLAKLEVGHAFQMLGKNVLAAEVFSELDRTWKDADPDFPPVRRLRTYQHRPASQMQGLLEHH